MEFSPKYSLLPKGFQGCRAVSGNLVVTKTQGDVMWGSRVILGAFKDVPAGYISMPRGDLEGFTRVSQLQKFSQRFPSVLEISVDPSGLRYV